MKGKKSRKSAKATAGCLFAGMGGFAQGLKQAGIDVRWANEFDSRAASTFKANHSNVRLIEKSVDSLSVSGDKLQPVDILAAGFPCTSFSMAGHRRGFDDERGELFSSIPRLLKEFGERRPAIVLLENVPNLLNGERGLWFERIRREIQSAGYWFTDSNCKVLDTAKCTRIPQRRPRVFMVAASMHAFDCNGFIFPEDNGVPDRLSNYINRRKKQSKEHYLPPDNRFCEVIERKMAEGKRESIYQLRRFYARENVGVSPPLTANMGGGGHNVPFVGDKWGIRRLTVEECSSLQGFPQGYIFPDEVPKHERYKQIGNSVSVPLIEMLGVECVNMLKSLSKA